MEIGLPPASPCEFDICEKVGRSFIREMNNYDFVKQEMLSQIVLLPRMHPNWAGFNLLM